jgi:nucleolar complex protein 3
MVKPSSNNSSKVQNKQSNKKRKLNTEKPAKPFRKAPVVVEKDVDEMTIEEKCNWIAELSESILEDPSTAFSSSTGEDGENKSASNKTPSKMRKLLEMANLNVPSSDDYTARLALLSLVAIYQDILPSYRIRLPTPAETSVKVSKETKQMWDYERALLTSYQAYLKLLERTWDRYYETSKPLAVTAVLALCELLKSAPHFNFRSNILKVVVRQMNHRGSPEVGEACCVAMEYVFESDAQGDIALEATRLVCKLICKDTHFKVKPRVLQTFQSLPLRVHLDEAQAAKLATQANSKKRKKNREEAEIESEMQEGVGSVSKILLARSQSDTLQAVTVAYFSILKNTESRAAEELLPVALTGLAKIAHLINMDTVLDLLDVLKTMLQRVNELPLDAALNCVLCAFSTLQGPGRELKIDQKEYMTPLYTQLPRLALADSDESTDIALKCLDAAFLKRREYSTVRMASFCKQLAATAFHSAPPTAAPILAFLRHLLHRYQSLHQLLENEQDVITSGQYDATAQDPEHANPFATSVWELSLLAFHMHPSIQKHSSRAASLQMLSLPTEAPINIRSELLKERETTYIPSRRTKKKHPLLPRDGQKQARFIAPNPTANLHLNTV